MRSFLTNIIKIIAVFVGGCIVLITLIFLPTAISVLHNEIRLVFIKEQTKKYAHPLDSKLIQRISIIGNFAPASNQCGFMVGEVRTTMLTAENIHAFYAPILISSEDKPPYHEVNLFILGDEKEIKDLERFYHEAYEQILPNTMNNPHAYLLLITEVNYPPNNDLRCH